MSGNRASVLVGLLSVLITSLIAVRVLSEVGWDVSVFAAFGQESIATRMYAEERLGEVHLRSLRGHDGKYFFVQANDPWVLNPKENAQVLDRPLYRSQRMLYPVLASGAGLFSPETIIVAMLVVNLLAMGVGSWITAHIAMEMGGSPWWGLAFALNLGFINEVHIGGAGVVAAVAAFGAVLMLMRDRVGWGIVLLSLAALAREAMLIVAAGIAVWLWAQRHRKLAIVTAGIPITVVLSWAAYLQLRIGNGSATPQIQEIGWPFAGFVGAFESWFVDPLNLVAGVAMMVTFVVYTRRVLSSRHVVGWAFIGFVALGVVLSSQVWRLFFDITRAIAPIITSFLLLAFLDSQREARVEINEPSVET